MQIQVFMDAQGNEQPVLREVQRDMMVYQFSPTPPLDEIGPFSPIQIGLDTQTRTCLASNFLRVLASSRHVKYSARGSRLVEVKCWQVQPVRSQGEPCYEFYHTT